MEKVENTALPRIEIFCGSPQAEPLARAVGYGIEEEGLPLSITVGGYLWTEVWEACQSPGLGVTVLVKEGSVAVFTRQLQEKRPLFDVSLREEEVERAKTIGKNAARIVKNKPFIGLEDPAEEDKNIAGGDK